MTSRSDGCANTGEENAILRQKVSVLEQALKRALLSSATKSGTTRPSSSSTYNKGSSARDGSYGSSSRGYYGSSRGTTERSRSASPGPSGARDRSGNGGGVGVEVRIKRRRPWGSGLIRRHTSARGSVRSSHLDRRSGEDLRLESQDIRLRIHSRLTDQVVR